MALRLLLSQRRSRPSRLAQRKREKRITYGALIFSFCIALFSVLAYTANKQDLLIQTVSVEGNSLAPTSELIKKANEELSGAYVWFFPKRNQLLVRTGFLASELERSFPEIESLEVQRSVFNPELSIFVRERTPYAIWCGTGIADRGKGSPCYFMDKQGLLFTEAPDYSSDVYLKFLSESSASTTPGNFLFPSERFLELSFFLTSLDSEGISVRSVSVEREGQIEDFILSLAEGAKLYVSGEKSLEETLENIRAFFKDPQIASTSPDFLEQVEYVDFRFGNKVYYRYLR